VHAQAPDSSAQQSPAAPRGETSYAPVSNEEDIAKVIARMKAAKPEVMNRQQNLLKERYELTNRPASGVTMSRGKPIQDGVRVKLPAGVTWQQLAEMSPAQIREKSVFPKAFSRCPIPTRRKEAWYFHISRLRKSRSRKDVT
jgi:hypothetical protein